jgi:hypothetical protein
MSSNSGTLRAANEEHELAIDAISFDLGCTATRVFVPDLEVEIGVRRLLISEITH